MYPLQLLQLVLILINDFFAIIYEAMVLASFYKNSAGFGIDFLAVEFGAVGRARNRENTGVFKVWGWNLGRRDAEVRFGVVAYVLK